MKKLLWVTVLFLTVAVSGACVSETPEPEPEPPSHPTVTDVYVERSGGTYLFTVTVSSEYDSTDRWADAIRVRSASGEEYGVRELGRHHADEQPFTRQITDVEVPDDVTVVIVEGRDSKNGWGGQSVEVDLTEISSGRGGAA
ncbi:hypothetical protein [Natronoglycomyces albus]|uniref:Uncharacterized protein n=1 Tax=Natronoglycomyces albus TaxID=2811108 RepID=A0A895XR31_9ACTN|nr:hypothetical protein [Natronoglycomyces albus]QSB05615.1 hypothetical protein JQS30_01405 [Natronoglycomyces albus]